MFEVGHLGIEDDGIEVNGIEDNGICDEGEKLGLAAREVGNR